MNRMPKSHFVLVGISAGLRTTIGERALSKLYQAHPHVRIEIVDDPAHFAAAGHHADALIMVAPPFAVASDWLPPRGRLRWVQSIPAGVNHLLTPELVAARQVVITSTKGPMGSLMAEHVVLLMLALARDLPGFLEDQRTRRWRHMVDERPMRQLFGKTIAILGVGAVGGALARMCKVGFGMTVLGMARTRRDNPHVDHYFDHSALHANLEQADFVALCMPLTSATERIVDGPALAAIKPSAYLINIARGALVDEAALVEALHSGQLAGAGLDATTIEPLPADSPLWSLPNVIITPHVAPARDRLGEQMVAFWCENIRRFVESQPLLGLVDRDAGY